MDEERPHAWHVRLKDEIIRRSNKSFPDKWADLVDRRVWSVCVYYSAENNFERFRGFWELVSRFEFDSSWKLFLLSDSNFRCVRGSITCNVIVHVYVLWLVCTCTIP